MHLGNSIICPYTAAIMGGAMGVSTIWAIRNAKNEFKKEDIIKTVVLATFVFALQMINFSIPAMQSSIHIIGGLLLAILLGKNLGFLSMALILTIQALFFNDGGLMTLGCNIFNMGFIPCFLVYPFIYKPLKNKTFLACIISSFIAIQSGALFASAEIALFNKTNFFQILYLMQISHLLLGFIEGMFCSAVIWGYNKFESKKNNTILASISVVLAGIVSNYASIKPDGLEWTLLKSDTLALSLHNAVYNFSNLIQIKLSHIITNNMLALLLVAFFAFLMCLALNTRKLSLKV